MIKKIYAWIKEKIRQRESARSSKRIHDAWLIRVKYAEDNFPYVVEFEGDWSFGGYMDDLATWCIDNIGHNDGECEWYQCQDSFDRWYDEHNFDYDLEILINEATKNLTKGTKEYSRESSKAIYAHYEELKKRDNYPEEHHSHSGTWQAHCFKKTGYDSGIFKFFFKNIEDATTFKLIWKE